MGRFWLLVTIPLNFSLENSFNNFFPEEGQPVFLFSISPPQRSLIFFEFFFYQVPLPKLLKVTCLLKALATLCLFLVLLNIKHVGLYKCCNILYSEQWCLLLSYAGRTSISKSTNLRLRVTLNHYVM